MKVKYPLLASAIAGIFTPALAADLSTYDLGTIVVTPARAPQKLNDALRNVTVITAEDIAQGGQQSLPDLLQARGNVEVKTVGGPGQPASIFMRGANSTHTLILIDGVRLDNITSGATALEHIPLAQIERIEILRAPASSLYGADAIGGVIQIFTKDAKGPDSIELSAGFGAYRTENLAAGLRRRFGDTHLQIQLAHSASQGFSATNERAGATFNPDRDPYRNDSVSVKLAHTLSPGHDLGLNLFEARGRVHFDAYASTLDDRKDETLTTYTLYSRNRVNERWESLLTFARGSDDYRFFNTAFPSTTRSIQDQIAWQNDLRLDTGKLSLGLEHANQRLTSSINYDRKERTVTSVFGVYGGDFGSHGLQLSARHDDNSQFGGHGTGNIDYGYRINSAWRIVAGAGTAFKAPSFQDLYYPNFSNPDLKPERSTHYEAGIRYAEGTTRFAATWFNSRITDLIVFASRPENINKADIAGIELSAGAQLAGFNLAANATVQNAEDRTTGKRLRLRSKTFGSLQASRRFGEWLLGGEWQASGDRYDSTNEAAASRLPGYGVVNLTASYALSKDLSLQGRWNNVFDRGYELSKGYNMPGSNLYVGLRYQLR